ncbi:phosphoglycolate phosphatase [Octadecabacter temperatus]|uniref:phosphoglycolate phosphatase n=1 Tax=Octadecabacter temperatus TaxID=1458307 RepID=A0A0K0Y3A1_9RHOB|nr:HAD family hydrolase [Octadecabacter temperatus]AKS45434.1 Phosphoglycolate phosphatase [Octadecabacter temperatus]SIN92829.1 phosphoglycolate phosphatase [Octadecabacter temperatus]
MTVQQIKGVVFDKDGTLFDFNATWGAWARDVFVAETKAEPSRLVELADALGYDLDAGLFRPGSLVIASTVSEIAQAALPFVPETSVDALVDRFNAAAILAPQVETTALVPFLTSLKDAGLKLGVATNDGEAPARAHLAAAQTEALFDFIVGSDSGFGGKPAAGQLHGFCEATGLAAHTCAMVGDSTHDLHAGRAAGMATVAVLTGVAGREELAPHADVVLNSIAELPEWLGI